MTVQFPTLRHSVAASMADYRQRLAAKIGEEMARKSWTIEDLAYHSGVSDRTIERLLDGQHEARRSTVRRLAEGLEVDPVVFSPEAESDQLQRLEEKLDEVLRYLRGDAQAVDVKRLADEARAEVPPPARQPPRKPRAASR